MQLCCLVESGQVHKQLTKNSRSFSIIPPPSSLTLVKKIILNRTPEVKPSERERVKIVATGHVHYEKTDYGRTSNASN